MFTLNLPKPSQHLLDALYQDLHNALPNYVPGDYLKPGRADGLYIHDRTLSIGVEEYKQFFTDDFYVFGMMLKPDPWITLRPNHYHTSSYPPHCDLDRLTGLNFIIDKGGNNVTTTFYDKTRTTETNENVVVEETTVTPIKKYHYDKETWYALDGSRYHSVENIGSDRLLLMIAFKTLPFSEFLIKYSHLIDKIV